MEVTPKSANASFNRDWERGFDSHVRSANKPKEEQEKEEISKLAKKCKCLARAYKKKKVSAQNVILKSPFRRELKVKSRYLSISPVRISKY